LPLDPGIFLIPAPAIGADAVAFHGAPFWFGLVMELDYW
jgi:hypothetical protein